MKFNLENLLYYTGVWIFIFILVVMVNYLRLPDDITYSENVNEGFESQIPKANLGGRPDPRTIYRSQAYSKTHHPYPWRRRQVWPTWRWRPFYRYYYYDPWFWNQNPFNQVCNDFAIKSCDGAFYPKECYRRHYHNCVVGSIG